MLNHRRVSLRVFAILLAIGLAAGIGGCAAKPENSGIGSNEKKDVTQVGVTPTKKGSVVFVPPTAKPEAKTLPKFESLEQLLDTMKNAGVHYNGIRGDIADADDSVGIAPPVAAAPSAENEAVQDGDFSQINSQVEGVDEGDILASDGKCLYAFSSSRQSVYIVGVSGADMKLLAEIPLSADADSYTRLIEIYVRGDYLVLVTGSSEHLGPINTLTDTAAPSGFIWYPTRQFTQYTVYDISDRENPVLSRSFEVEGNAVSTRMIGDVLYFVSTRYVYALPYDTMEGIGEGDILPVYRDTVSNEKYQVVPPQDIYYFPESTEPTYMFVGAFDITGEESAAMDSFIGAGNQVYMSAENLYVASNKWDSKTGRELTQVYRFAIDGASISFAADGAFEGSLLNQYSMDEYNGVFRAATTSWGQGNYVNTLDAQTLKPLGRTEALAPDEQIKSVRFMGDIGYVVTFRQTDPLFAIDLSDPSKPAILGQLKIPGFSTYLHPVADGLLIGFGRNVIETYVDLPGGGREVVGTLDVGLKVSLFDVSDPTDPKEIDVLALGRNTHSSACDNPRAMMVDAKRGIFGFDVIDYNYTNYETYNRQPQSMFGLIEVRGRELVDLATLKDLDASNKYERRLCYIGDTLYGVDGFGITAYSYQSFERLARLDYSSKAQ
ncbi:MAG: beta-propeller domain-containing protein [Oscillospiraceae bacterium]|jgi:uncharacterized secreted protein with C-terminal beta-propeller domain|nr:beta-propeller domain-containing protein [Oscillospiraceae bacterium]